MPTYFSNPSRLLVFVSILIISCSKSSDPVPLLGAQTNAILLAGEKGKSKSWKLTQVAYSSGSAAPAPLAFDPCFMDNVFTFTNNDAQTYVGAEGATKCDPADPATFESGTWAFTLDGFTLNIECNGNFAPNGLFSSEVYIGQTSGGSPAPFNFGFAPYPMSVTKLDATNLVLQVTESFVTSSNNYNYKLTFVAQ